MKTIIQKSLLLLAFCVFTTSVFSQCSTKKHKENTTNSVVQSINQETNSDIVDIAAGNEAFSTLVAAVKAADLVGALKSEGPFTVFAPTNDAFAKLPEGTIESLLAPESKETLATILTYHVVSGKLDSGAVLGAIKSGGGSATVETLSGGQLTASIVDGNVTLTDENGNTSTVTTVDVEASNGVIHIIDTVVLPK